MGSATSARVALWAFLPSWMLAGFGLSLIYIAYLVSQIPGLPCPNTSAFLPAGTCGITDYEARLTLALWIAGLVTLAASAAAAIIISMARDRRLLRRAAPGLAGGREGESGIPAKVR